MVVVVDVPVAEEHCGGPAHDDVGPMGADARPTAGSTVVVDLTVGIAERFERQR
jgi:hypothetical protein